ncbi:hypothetical protein [Jidongwangia harbinensis]|uniref:hypothetical protein n=1 Tax=Jidongwangia harbinensis TaxID=2878561 RepID=UPI001CDA3CBA|nr:hypothetical protein [Jidongwangia harbinensis]MCA2213959.1 hypothetical protein [Jidongwangia harbinensis]
MTNENGSWHRPHLVTAVLLLVVAMIAGTLVHSGTVTGGPLRHWYGDVAFWTAHAGIVLGATTLLFRAYRG